MAVHKSYIAPAQQYKKSIPPVVVVCSVYCFARELAVDDIYIYPLDYAPFPNNVLTSGRFLHWSWGHISVIAEGKLLAVPYHLGEKKNTGCVF